MSTAILAKFIATIILTVGMGLGFYLVGRLDPMDHLESFMKIISFVILVSFGTLIILMSLIPV